VLWQVPEGFQASASAGQRGIGTPPIESVPFAKPLRAPSTRHLALGPIGVQRIVYSAPVRWDRARSSSFPWFHLPWNRSVYATAARLASRKPMRSATQSFQPPRDHLRKRTVGIYRRHPVDDSTKSDRQRARAYDPRRPRCMSSLGVSRRVQREMIGDLRRLLAGVPVTPRNHTKGGVNGDP
jgi:hypothetical protein